MFEKVGEYASILLEQNFYDWIKITLNTKSCSLKWSFLDDYHIKRILDGQK